MEIRSFLDRLNPLAIPRFLLCISLIIIFVFNDIYDFYPEEYFSEMQKLDKFWFKEINFFYQFGFDNLVYARIIVILILLVCAFGIFPGITCWLHTWIAYSFISSSILVEGGDQMNAIISLFLIPFCVNHGSDNFWIMKDFKTSYLGKYIASLSHYSIQIQLAACYLLAGFSKYNVAEWRNGEALYFWLNNNVFGANEGIINFINNGFLSNQYSLYFATMFVLIVEFCGCPQMLDSFFGEFKVETLTIFTFKTDPDFL